MRAGSAPHGFILREDAMCAVNDEGQSIMPWDVLPDGKDNPYRDKIAPLYVCWLLCYLDELREHGWPDMPYNDNRTDHTGIPQDPIQAAMAFVAEVTTRMDRCGTAGNLAVAYYRDAIMPEELVTDYRFAAGTRKDRRRSEEQVCRDIKAAVQYCAGRRKKWSFEVWRNHGHWRRKECQPTTR